jgi:hypothetical protein
VGKIFQQRETWISDKQDTHFREKLCNIWGYREGDSED